MNLMKGITGYRGLRERKRGEDWERIWKRFGDTKLNSQELEKQGEINLPKECLKGFVIRRAIVNHWQADRLLFLTRGHGDKLCGKLNVARKEF